MLLDISIKQAAEFLKSRNNFLIVSHTSPDADTLGSATALALALRSLGKVAYAICDEPIPKKLTFMGAESCFVEKEPDGIATFISVDVASPSMMGDFTQVYKKFDLSIDHHSVNTMVSDYRLLKVEYSSCGELIFELLEELDVELTQDIAIALYSAISSDSGGFRFSSTRPQTMCYAAKLMETGIDFAKINRLLFESKSPSQIALERLAYNTIELYFNGKLAVVAIPEDALKKINADERDIDGINQIPRQISGVEVSAVIRRKNDKIKVSLRSNDYYNVAEHASTLFGGGGHHHAAGCAFDALANTVASIKQTVIDSFKDKFNEL